MTKFPHIPPLALKRKALLALEEALRQAGEGPVLPSMGLRFALAFLYSVSDGNRAHFDRFWKEALNPRSQRGEIGNVERNAVCNASLNGIYRSVGYERGSDTMFYSGDESIKDFD